MTNNIASELFSITKAFAGGGMVSTMRGVDKSKPDFKIISNLANLFAKEGHEVWILANVHFKSKEYEVVFGKLTGTKYERKCPDLLIDGVFYEYEGFEKPWNRRKIKNMLAHGFLQSSRIIIDNTKGASDRLIRKSIMARLRIGTNINEVWLYEKGYKRLFFYNGIFL